MSSTKRRFRLLSAFAALATLALAVSCTGFFVNPTLTGVSVGPQGLTININQTWQMTATGSYSDGSQKNLSSGVAWSSSDPTTVSVGQSSGQVSGLQIGSATVTASSGGCAACAGSTTVTVVLTGVTSILVSRSPTTLLRHSRARSILRRTEPGRLWIRPTPIRRQTSHSATSPALVRGLRPRHRQASGHTP
jgi:hypothetical protein